MNIEYAKVFFEEVCEYLEYNNIKLYELSEGSADWLFDDVEDFYYDAGCTRGCFIPMTDYADIVLKFNFDNVSDDYCEAEVRHFKRAKLHGLDDIFTKMVKIGTRDGIDVYACERVSETSTHYGDVSPQLSRYLRKTTFSEGEDKKYPVGVFRNIEYWLKEFVRYYGAKKYFDFVKFIKEEGINDLHGGNVGYINNRPVVFDYGGFYEGDDEDSF